jgi:hypothetical protein
MAMEHLGLPSVPGEFGCGAGEESEAPVFIFTPVDSLGIEYGMTHQIDRQATGGVAGFEDGEFSSHRESAPDRFRGNLQLAPQLAVPRHDDAHVMPQGRQGRRQGSHHVSHSPHLHHRSAFGRGKQNPHQTSGETVRNSTGAFRLPSGQHRHLRSHLHQLIEALHILVVEADAAMGDGLPTVQRWGVPWNPAITTSLHIQDLLTVPGACVPRNRGGSRSSGCREGWRAPGGSSCLSLDAPRWGGSASGSR